MKKTLVMFFVAALVILSVIVWIFHAKLTWGTQEILMVSGVVIIAGFALILGIKRLLSHLRKEPAEDEFSKKIMTRASSLSYYISLYLWLMLMYLSDETGLECHTLIGAGILGMALVFFFSWIGVKLLGTGHE
ncbi:MAG TPA: DUF2178 domain-containing protein [Bacteroidetes bacterium]|nr:DUF2178 domain-containing protein [Bacteroidota bacterium]